MSASPYGDDLAFVHAMGYGGFAQAAIAEVIPTLVAAGVRRVVDVGCGAGVTTSALVDAGFETIGVEPSPSLLALARDAAPGATLRLASAYDVELPACDAVLALGEPLTYHVPDADAEGLVRQLFSKVSEAIGPGGLLVFDVIEAGGESLDGRAWASGPDWAVLSESREDRATRRLVRRIETFRLVGDGSYRRGQEVHTVRLFERSAVTAWLEEAGFDVEVGATYGRFELARRRMAFTARRRS